MKLFIVIKLLFFSFACFSQNPATTGYMLMKENGSISVGTEVNTAPLTVANFSTTFPTPQTGTLIHVVSDAVTNGRFSFDTYNNASVNGSIFQGRRARGTAGIPTSAIADDILVAIGGDGYGADGFHNISLGGLTLRSLGTMTNTDAPTYLTFSTVPSGSTTQAERVRIKSDGTFQITGLTEGVIVTDASGNLSRIVGTAGQYLRRNAGNTAYEFGTLAGGGDLLSSNNLSDVANASTSRTNLGLGNVDNTSDVNKPVSTAQATAIAARGYTLNVQALTSSPTDGQTIYFGQLPKAPVTAAATSKVYIRKAGTIKIAQIYCYSGTAGTAEAWPVSIRLNNTTDTQIASLSVSASERIFTNSSLNISVAAGDYIEIKAVNPTWATNPLTTIWGGYIYIE